MATKLNKLYFGDLFINVFNKEQLHQNIVKTLSAKTTKPRVFIYINSGSFYYKDKDDKFDKMLKTADYIRVSGFFLRRLISFIYKIRITKIKTEDFIDDLLRYGQKKGLKTFLLGSDQATLNKALKNIKKKYPKLSIQGHHGYFNKDENGRLIKAINKFSPQIMIVGLGSYKQEVWVYDNKNKLTKVKSIFTVGNFIDIIGGKENIPPIFLRKIDMEWLYRIVREPRRLGKRYLVGCWLTIKHIIKS